MYSLFDRNLRALETFVVAAVGETTLGTAGNNLVNNTTGAVNLNNQQLGIISAGFNGTTAYREFLDATDTTVEAPEISIVQGTPSSASPGTPRAKYPLVNEPYISTSVISAIESPRIKVTKTAFAIGRQNIWGVIAPNVEDLTDYEIQIAFDGAFAVAQRGLDNLDKIRAYYTTPDYTNLSTAVPLDDLIQNLSYEINRKSKLINFTGAHNRGTSSIVAFAVATSGATGTLISGLVAGAVLPVVTVNGVTKNITLNAQQAASLVAAGVATGATRILNINLTTAGTTTNGSAAQLWVMAVDNDEVAIDDFTEFKTRLRVGLSNGFSSPGMVGEIITTFEGTGYGRVLNQMYKNTHNQRKYQNKHEDYPIFEYPSFIDVSLNYHVYTIEHGTRRQPDLSTHVIAPKIEFALIPTGNTTLVTNFEAVLYPWATSAGATITSI